MNNLMLPDEFNEYTERLKYYDKRIDERNEELDAIYKLISEYDNAKIELYKNTNNTLGSGYINNSMEAEKVLQSYGYIDKTCDILKDKELQYINFVLTLSGQKWYTKNVDYNSHKTEYQIHTKEGISIIKEKTKQVDYQERCKDCSMLVESNSGKWFCDETGKLCQDINECDFNLEH